MATPAPLGMLLRMGMGHHSAGRYGCRAQIDCSSGGCVWAATSYEHACGAACRLLVVRSLSTSFVLSRYQSKYGREALDVGTGMGLGDQTYLRRIA